MDLPIPNAPPVIVTATKAARQSINDKMIMQPTIRSHNNKCSQTINVDR